MTDEQKARLADLKEHGTFSRQDVEDYYELRKLEEEEALGLPPIPPMVSPKKGKK